MESSPDEQVDILDLIKKMKAEIKAWRQGINHRNMNKAKVGAIYVPEWTINAAIKQIEASK